MEKVLSPQEVDALCVLVKRINKDVFILHWIEFDSTKDIAICNICKLEFDFDDWVEHGLQHLKDYNLLLFV